MANSTSNAIHFFTATLGEAQIYNAEHPHRIRNINQLLDQRAAENPDKPAVGIARPDYPTNSGDWGCTIYSRFYSSLYYSF